MNKNKNKLRHKSLTSFCGLWAFLILSVSGVFLYFTPAGRIANWIDWTLLGISKEGWQGLHTIFAILFLIVVCFHLYFNWRVLISYFKSKVVEGIRMKRELLISLLITGFFLLVSLFQLQPFWKLTEWREDIKHFWSTAEVEPPVPHTEEMTLDEVAVTLGLSYDEVEAILKEHDISGVEPSAVWGDLAHQRDVSPQDLYREVFGVLLNPQIVTSPRPGQIKRDIQQEHYKSEMQQDVKQPPETQQSGTVQQAEHEPGHEEHAGTGIRQGSGLGQGQRSGTGAVGGGYGRMTVRQLCDQYGVSVSDGLKRLESQGIKANSGDRVRAVADKHNLRPSQIILIIQQ